MVQNATLYLDGKARNVAIKTASIIHMIGG
jgi:hypothetical protein